MAENFKTDFFTDRIGRGIQDIFQAQLDIATNRIYQKGRERRKVQGLSLIHIYPTLSNKAREKKRLQTGVAYGLS